MHSAPTKHLPVVQAYERFDEAMGRIVTRARELGHTVPCRDGCAACCSDIAWVGEPELGPMVERIRRWHPSKQAHLRDDIETWGRRVRGAGIDLQMAPIEGGPDAGALRSRYYGAHAVCPMLDRARSRCMAYEERPIACRGHWLIDEPASKCANLDKDPVTQNIANVEPLIDAMFAIHGSRPPDFAFLPVALGRLLARTP